MLSTDLGPYLYSYCIKRHEHIKLSAPLMATRTIWRSSLDKVRPVRFEVSTAVTMKKGVFWDVTPCDSCKNRRFGGTLRLLHQGYKNRRTSYG
jgi:hypothetical protein